MFIIHALLLCNKDNVFFNSSLKPIDVYKRQVHTFKGKDHIFEEMEGLRFKAGPKSFYQTNSEQAYNLYKVARNFAGLTGNELVCNKFVFVALEKLTVFSSLIKKYHWPRQFLPFHSYKKKFDRRDSY